LIQSARPTSLLESSLVLGVDFGTPKNGNAGDTPCVDTHVHGVDYQFLTVFCTQTDIGGHAHPQNRRVRCVVIGPDDCSMFGVRDVHHIRYGSAMCHVREGSDHIIMKDASTLLLL